MSGRLALLLVLVLVLAGSAEARPTTVPALQEWTPAKGTFALRGAARVIVRGRRLRDEGRQLARDLRALRSGPARLALHGRARRGDVVLRRGGPARREGYALRIGRAFSIRARTGAGAFYGGRSLLQLIRGGEPIRRGRAVDWPRYPERGLMVDAGRKFYEPAWLAARIRELADLKLNYLHLHLSDNQGFRIASSTHPEIVSKEHLTKPQVRRLLALARRHHVTVVPEIDMPGHMTAALAAHPEFQLSDALGNREASVLDVTNPDAVRFAKDLVGEYLRLFDGPYWHLGADEVLPFAVYPLGRYPVLEAYARERYGPIATGKDAIHGFVNDMDDFVRARGRTARMWHDDVGGGSAVTRNADIVTEWWINASPLSDVRTPTPQELLDAGHRIINGGWFPTYVVNGVGGSTAKIRPDLRAAYEQWRVHDFYGIRQEFPPDSVAEDEPGNLGAVAHLWNDNPTLTTADEDAAAVTPVLRVLAQQTWESPPLVSSYEEFERLAARVARQSAE